MAARVQAVCKVSKSCRPILIRPDFGLLLNLRQPPLYTVVLEVPFSIKDPKTSLTWRLARCQIEEGFGAASVPLSMDGLYMHQSYHLSLSESNHDDNFQTVALREMRGSTTWRMCLKGPPGVFFPYEQLNRSS